MSKLFDTLEKIRLNEAPPATRVASGSSAKVTSSKNTKKILPILTAIVVIVAGIYSAMPYFSSLTNKSTEKKQVTAKARKSTPSTKPKAAPPKNNKPASQKVKKIANTRPKGSESFSRFNKLATQHFHNSQPWIGLYYYQKANKEQPSRIEPLINMAVIYAELGFNQKAISFLKKAYAINPDFPPLKKNIQILQDANYLDSKTFYDVP